jgi:uncharacterized membrane protein
MSHPLTISLAIGLVLGSLNHFYLKSRGHNGSAQWFMQVVVFFALAFSVLKFFR